MFQQYYTIIGGDQGMMRRVSNWKTFCATLAMPAIQKGAVKNFRYSPPPHKSG